MSRLLVLALSLSLAACGNSQRAAIASTAPGAPAAQEKQRTRYAFNNQCFALLAIGNQRHVVARGSGFVASAERAEQAEAFFFKPAALGQYLLYTQAGNLMSSANPVVTRTLANADDSTVLTLRGLGDSTAYPAPQVMELEADAAQIKAYRDFVEPNVQYETFTWTTLANTQLAIDRNGGLITQAAGNEKAAQFAMTPLAPSRCAEFAEAQSNVDGESFKGTLSNGQVLGFADTHLHATSTTFLGGAKPGTPFHRFGVTHALHDCDAEHGPTGQGDVVGSLFTGDADGHSTMGWPRFVDWPSRTATTHEATYWKWIERAWKAGLRLTVNFAVENETLCEVQRNATQQPTRNCNEMVSARRQIATAWAMQDYIDAQYGGRGKGWLRIVTSPVDARTVMARGQMALLLGVEVSNLMNCSVTFNPANTQEGFEEDSAPATGQTYGCAMTETGAPNEILTQLQGLRDIGVSNLFTIHEFDNAFGGNDIFEGLVLNLGNKENSGGLTSADTAAGQAGATVPTQVAAISHLQTNGLAGTGEFWSTHDCPGVDTPEVGGSVFPVFGTVMTNLGPPPPLCAYTGRGGRPGGKTACYPAAPQCNARTLTPMGLYAFEKIMEMGFIFEIDHLGYEIKNQLLDLSEAQTPAYPTVSAHGFSGLSLVQAKRIYASGGLVYPTFNDARDFIALWRKLKPAWQASGARYPFAIGFGSDTNGLSPQSGPRIDIEPGREVVYPFTLFKGDGFEGLSEFANVAGLRFDQPASRAPDGQGRSWHVDIDGNAHYGMAADSVEELRQEGTPELLRDLYHSADVYVQFWERTQVASAAVRRKGLIIPEGLLRPATR